MFDITSVYDTTRNIYSIFGCRLTNRMGGDAFLPFKYTSVSDLDVEIRVMNSFGLINESQMDTPSFVLLTSQ